MIARPARSMFGIRRRAGIARRDANVVIAGIAGSATIGASIIAAIPAIVESQEATAREQKDCFTIVQELDDYVSEDPTRVFLLTEPDEQGRTLLESHQDAVRCGVDVEDVRRMGEP